MPPKPTSAEIARQVIAELRQSDAFVEIVKQAVKEAVADVVTRLEAQEGRILELEGKVRDQAAEIEYVSKEIPAECK